MTKQEAIKNLEYTKRRLKMPRQGSAWKPSMEAIAIDIAIQVLQGLTEREQAEGWISVKDRLPEMTDGFGFISNKVLVAQGVNDKQINFGWRRGCEWVASYMIPFARQELITHWMPLPEPPKEDKE